MCVLFKNSHQKVENKGTICKHFKVHKAKKILVLGPSHVVEVEPSSELGGLFIAYFSCTSDARKVPSKGPFWKAAFLGLLLLPFGVKRLPLCVVCLC